MKEEEYKKWLIEHHGSNWKKIYDMWLSLPLSVRGTVDEIDTNYGTDAHVFIVLNDKERDAYLASMIGTRSFKVLGYKWLDEGMTMVIKHPTVHNNFKTSKGYSWMKPVFRVEQITNFCHPL